MCVAHKRDVVTNLATLARFLVTCQNHAFLRSVKAVHSYVDCATL